MFYVLIVPDNFCFCYMEMIPRFEVPGILAENVLPAVNDKQYHK